MALIMVVDDDDETRVLLDSILVRDAGHDVRYAEDGHAAIARFEATRPDVVITDIEMPRLNGVALIRHLKQVQAGAGVIAISGKGLDRLERAIDAGALIALTKPLDRATLLDAVERAIHAPDPWSREPRSAGRAGSGG